MNFKDYIKITSRHLESLENKEVFNENLKKEIIKSEGIYIVGIGSSYYASLMAKQYFEYLNVEIKVIKSEDFNKQENLKKNWFSIVVSQGGDSNSSLECVAHAKKFGIKVLGITQNVKSNFSNKTDFVVDMGFGFEENYCKAIGVSTTLYLLYRLGVEIYKSSDMQMLFETVKTINYIFDKTSKLIESKTLKFENDYQKLCWISNYTQMGIAMEAALKTSEMMWTNSIYTGCDEFLHGFESCLNKNDLYFIIDFDQKNEFADSTWLFLKKQNVQVINLEKVLPLPNGWNNSNNFFINLLVLIMVQLILDYLRSTYKIEMKDIPRFKNVTEITKLK